METDPINPAPADSSSSMEVKSTDPIESSSPLPETTTTETPGSAAPLPGQDKVQKPDSISQGLPPVDPIPREPVAEKDSAVAPGSTPIASEAIIERVQVASTGSSKSSDASDKGGEWDLLNSKVRQWWEDNNLVDLWQRSRRPIYLLIGLIGFILVIRIYSGILAAISSIPLAPRMFELVGLGWVIWFSTTRLIRTDERRALLKNVTGIWGAFRGSNLP